MKAKIEDNPDIQNKGVKLTSENDEEKLMLERLWNEHGRPAELSKNPDGSRSIVIAPTPEEQS